MGNNVRIEGLSGLLRVMRSYANDVPSKTKQATKKAGFRLQGLAKKDAPVDTGKLRQSINLEIEGDGLVAKVTANAPYAPYIEFGTGGEVQIPDGWAEIAAEFKGKGIKTINRKPKPFLIPNFNKVSIELKEEIQQIMEL